MNRPGSVPSLLVLTGCLLLVPAVPGAGQAGAAAANKRPKNIVVVLVDDLGWADLGCYGSRFHDTPNLDKLAGEGVRFTQAYAASTVCSPTRAALLTGRHPVRVGITDWIRGFEAKNPPLRTPEDRDELALEEVTIAEVLKEHGYATGYVGKWHLGETAEYWPEHQGFDVNFGGFSKGQPPAGYYSPYNNPRLKDGPDGEYLTDRLTDEAIGFVRREAAGPFFLYLAYYTVHTPIQGCAKWDAHYAAKREEIFIEERDVTRAEGPAQTRLRQSDAKYAAMVRSLDENVGRLLATLDELGLRDETVVAFTSDNGGLSTQPGKIAPTAVLPLRAGKGWLYEGGIRVPLIIRAPGIAAPGAVSAQAAVSMDLFPTLLESAGLAPRPELHRDGVSLAPALRGPGAVEPRTLVWHYPHYHASGWTPGSAIRVGDWKLIERYETGALELYDLSTDPSEERDLAGSQPEQLARMKQALDTWRAGAGAALPAPAAAGIN